MGQRRIERRMDERVIDLAAGYGLPRGELAPLLGDDPEWVLEADHFSLWTRMMELSGDPRLPVLIGSQVPIEEYGLLALAVKTAATVREGLAQLARYLRVWTEVYGCRVEQRRAVASVIIERFVDAGVGGRCGHEAAVVELVCALRDVAGPELEIEAVRLRHRAPPDRSAHDALCGVPVRFGSTFDGVDLPRAALDLPLVLSDKGLASYLAEQLAARASREPRPALAASLERVVLDLLPGGLPPLAAVARQLGLGPRTLQRRLAEAGTTLTTEIDAARDSAARQLLGGSDRSISEIAFMLGFSRPSAFHRAFRRWASMTPAEFRQATRRSS